MYFELFCLLIASSLAVAGSLTFWPVQHWWDFYIPIVLFLAGYLVALFGILWNFVAISGKIMVNRKSPREKPSAFARWLLVEGVTYITAHAFVIPQAKGLNKIPKRQKYLMVCNHRSMFDNFIISRMLGKNVPLAFISKPSNMKIPLTKGVCYPQGYMTIDRDDKEQSLEVMRTMVNYINEDYTSVCIFPEGTRQKNLEMGKFHEGVFNVAIHAHCPIVVTTISGTNKIHKNFPWKWTKVRFDILCTIPFEEFEGKPAKEVSDMVHNMMEEHLHYLEKVRN